MGDGLAAAMIESQRVEAQLMALGFDRLAIHRAQQEIADLHTSTTLSWHAATERVMDRILADSGADSGSDGPAEPADRAQIG